jgi:hypothetical protein
MFFPFGSLRHYFIFHLYTIFSVLKLFKDLSVLKSWEAQLNKGTYSPPAFFRPGIGLAKVGPGQAGQISKLGPLEKGPINGSNSPVEAWLTGSGGVRVVKGCQALPGPPRAL